MFSPFQKTSLTRTLFFVVSDIILIVLAVWLAFLLRFDGSIPPQYYYFVFRMAGLAVIFTVPVFYFQKLYSFSWSYVSTSELVSLFKGTTISFIFLGITIFVSNYFPYFINFPRSTIFISYILVFVFCSATRLSKRIYQGRLSLGKMRTREKTLIAGAGDAGEQILRNIMSSAESPYYPVGFVDDNPIKQDIKIHGVKVLGKISSIPEIVRKNQIKRLIIALPSADSKTIKDTVELGRRAGVWKIKIAPPIHEIIGGKVSLKNLRDIDAADLLAREAVKLNTKLVEGLIKNKVVLITGSAGSIGSELSRQSAKFNPSLLLLLDQDETGIFSISNELKSNYPELKLKSLVADIADEEKIKAIFSQYNIEVIFHAAAYKHVPLMEENPDQAVKNNIFGTQSLIKASLENKVKKFIFISTDKAVNPTSVMGISKRIGEMLCQAYGQKNQTKFIAVRFGNVLDSRGSVIPIFREQIKRGGPVEVTDLEMKRYFMLTKEACLLVMQAGSMGEGGEVFVLDMGKPIKILDLAKAMIKLSGFEPDRDIAITFIGKRPGEKLFEDILTAKEGMIATQNQKIFIAKLSDVNFLTIEKKIDNLKKIINKKEDREIISDLKEIISN